MGQRARTAGVCVTKHCCFNGLFLLTDVIVNTEDPFPFMREWHCIRAGYIDPCSESQLHTFICTSQPLVYQEGVYNSFFFRGVDSSMPVNHCYQAKFDRLLKLTAAPWPRIIWPPYTTMYLMAHPHNVWVIRNPLNNMLAVWVLISLA